jgi:hypothetical protein
MHTPAFQEGACQQLPGGAQSAGDDDDDAGGDDDTTRLISGSHVSLKKVITFEPSLTDLL